jgi:hypothetical protein
VVTGDVEVRLSGPANNAANQLSATCWWMYAKNSSGFIVPALMAVGTTAALTLACGVLAWSFG